MNLFRKKPILDTTLYDREYERLRNERSHHNWEWITQLQAEAVKTGKPQEIGMWGPTGQTLWIVATDGRTPPK